MSLALRFEVEMRDDGKEYMATVYLAERSLVGTSIDVAVGFGASPASAIERAEDNARQELERVLKVYGR